MKAEIISIGTELLLGHIIDTNASYLSRKLAELGIDIYYRTVIGDNPSRLNAILREVLSRSDIVITSGGLGPTVDDITVETIIRLAGKRSIKRVENHVGTAPGLIAQYGPKVIICLPGPPRELEPMFEKSIAPYLDRVQRGKKIIVSRIIKTTGLREAKVNKIAADLLQLKPPTTVGIYAKLGEVDLKIMAKTGREEMANNAIKNIEKKIKSRLKDYIFGYDDETLEGAVAKILLKKKKAIAISESCTGGLVSNRLTNVSGSSVYFKMGLVAYSNESKIKMLGVRPELIKKYGAVSREVALDMARGVMSRASADIGLGVTGIAGPTGGTKSKPVGLVYIAFASGKKRIVKKLLFKGSREDVKFRASQAVLELTRQNI